MLDADGEVSEVVPVSTNDLSSAATVVCNLKSDQH